MLQATLQMPRHHQADHCQLDGQLPLCGRMLEGRPLGFLALLQGMEKSRWKE